jgi:Xaa-Pro aminopeptidase
VQIFSETDFQDRIKKVLGKMSEVDLGALVILDTDFYIGGGNVRYLTNYYHLFDTMQMVLVVTRQEVTLCVVPGLGGGAFAVAGQQCPWIKNVVGSRSSLWGSDTGKDVKSALDKSGIRDGRIGVDGLGMVTESIAQSVRVALKVYRCEEETGIVEKLRMEKSPKEIEAIREAVRLADIGANTFMKSLRAGEPQYVAITKSENVVKLAGAEAVMVFMGVGKPWIWGQYPSRRVYEEGDMIAFEYNARYEGYYGQVNRTCVIGKASDKQKEMYQLALESYKAIETVIKPGVKVSELYHAGAQVTAKAGDPKPPRMGHGIGLNIAEGYEIDANDRTVLRPGYYIMVHTLAAIMDQGICAAVGNPIIVTDKSYEILSKAEYGVEV